MWPCASLVRSALNRIEIGWKWFWKEAPSYIAYIGSFYYIPDFISLFPVAVLCMIDKL